MSNTANMADMADTVHMPPQPMPMPMPMPIPMPMSMFLSMPKRLAPLWLGLLACALAGSAAAEPRGVAVTPPRAASAADPANALPDSLAAELRRLAADAAALLWAGGAAAPRIEVVVGRLDPRLKLAPCQQTVPYLPAGARPLGHTRLGLRCTQGPSLWNVSLPVDVRVWGQSLTAATSLPLGTVLEARHLLTTEVDLAERADPAIGQASLVLGRTLARGLAAGEALRRSDLKTRQWFNTGDVVRILASGPGYAISSEGQAMGPGLEGQSVRVRTEGGRIVSGMPVADRRIEVAL